MKIDWVRDRNRDIVRFFSEQFAYGGTFNHSRTSMPVSRIKPANPSTIFQAQAFLDEEV